ERSTHARRKRVQELVQQREVLLQIWWQLKQERAEFFSERRRGLEKLSDRVGAVAEARIVGDAPWRLEGELETRRRRTTPPVEDLFIGGSIERVVDLDRGKPLGIVRQHLRGRKRFWVKATFPFWIVVAGCADPNHCRPLGVDDLSVFCLQTTVFGPRREST